jgi:hypothetical protein
LAHDQRRGARTCSGRLPRAGICPSRAPARVPRHARGRPQSSAGGP